MGAGEILIDGSQGEGGGQIVRTALSLSVLTGRPVRLQKIRAGRSRPGLRPQHLQAVAAAAEVSAATVHGAVLGSQELLFIPGRITSGNYRFAIGTAGSTSLVLQTIHLPLACAGAPSRVEIEGGTHVPLSPAFDYLQQQWRPFLLRLGLNIDLELIRAGFYPRGGGRIDAVIHPARKLVPLRLGERGGLLRIRCLSLAANLPLSIAERQSRQAARRLPAYVNRLEVENALLPATGRGTVLFLFADFEHSSASFFALGERGKPAERVADEAADALLEFLDGDGAIDEHLADQLVLPLALSDGESLLRTARITRHLLTNLQVTSQFLPVSFQSEGAVGTPGTVLIRGIPLSELSPDQHRTPAAPTRKGNEMPEILIRCPVTGKDVPTGLALPAEVFLTSEIETRPVACPHCGERHAWSKPEAYLRVPPEREPHPPGP